MEFNINKIFPSDDTDNKKYSRKEGMIYFSSLLCLIFFFFLLKSKHMMTYFQIIMFAFLCNYLVLSIYHVNKYGLLNNNRFIRNRFIMLYKDIVFSSIILIFSFYQNFIEYYQDYYLEVRSIYILCIFGVIKVLIMTAGMIQTSVYVTKDSLLKKDVVLIYFMMLFITYINFSEYIVLAWRWGDTSALVLAIKTIIIALVIFVILYFLRKKNQLIKIIADKCDVLFPNKNNVMPPQ